MRVNWVGAVNGPTVLIGDSLAVGLAQPLKAEFGAEPFQAFAKGGTAVSQWLNGSQAGELAKALELGPKRVLVSLGTNDTNSKVPADQLKQQVAALVQKIRDVGAEPVWLSPGKLPWPYPDLIAAVAFSNARVVMQPDVKKFDGIHPTGDGYKEWAKAIYQDLNPSATMGTSSSTTKTITNFAVLTGLALLTWWVLS